MEKYIDQEHIFKSYGTALTDEQKEKRFANYLAELNPEVEDLLYSRLMLSETDKLMLDVHQVVKGLMTENNYQTRLNAFLANQKDLITFDNQYPDHFEKDWYCLDELDDLIDEFNRDQELTENDRKEASTWFNT